MDTLRLFITPILGGLIGYFTNWLAIKMLFLPHHELYLFGVKLPFTPGLIPKERKKIAAKIGDTVSEQLITDSVLKKSFHSAVDGLAEKFIKETVDKLSSNEQSLQEALKTAPPYASAMVDELLKELVQNLEQTVGKIDLKSVEFGKLDGKLLELTKKAIEDNLGKFVGAFINPEKVYGNIKKSVCNEGIKFLTEGEPSPVRQLAELIKSKILSLKVSELVNLLGKERLNEITLKLIEAARDAADSGLDFLSKTLDVREIVTERINELEIEQVEEMILTVAKRELNAITLAGGVLGFVIGFVPVIVGLFQ